MAVDVVPFGNVRVHLIVEGDAIVRMMRNGKAWEPETRLAWPELVAPDEVVIDVGAYTGVYAIASALLGAKVIAIEPHPRNFSRLQKNVHLNHMAAKVQTLQIAASSRRCVKVLRMKGLVEGLSDTASFHNHGTHMIQVQAKALDGISHKRDLSMRVGLMKIDVEHHELAVLKGARELIAANKPAIVIETLTNAEDQAVADFLHGFGYTLKRQLDRRNRLYVVEIPTYGYKDDSRAPARSAPKA
jgi:FkbM family methyltransferase